MVVLRETLGFARSIRGYVVVVDCAEVLAQSNWDAPSALLCHQELYGTGIPVLLGCYCIAYSIIPARVIDIASNSYRKCC